MIRCSICERRPPDRPHVCAPCRAGLASDLADVADLYARLVADEDQLVDDRPKVYPETGWLILAGQPTGDPADPIAAALPAGTVPSRAGGPVVSGTPSPALPVSLTRLDLLAEPRRLGTGLVADGDQIGQRPPGVLLELLVRDWIGAGAPSRRPPAPREDEPYVATLAWWLHRNADWACDEHPGVADAAAELRSLVGALRYAVGDQPVGKVIGRCPAPLDDGARCGRTLVADPWYATIACRCGAEWRRAQWPELRDAMHTDDDERTP